LLKLPTNITKNSKLLAAVSGGVDSMAMAIMLADYVKQHGHQLLCVTIDHNLRDESAHEVKQCGRILASQNIKHIILKNNSDIPTTNIQQEARNIRYNLLTDYAKQNGFEYILTAHTADDNIETFLMRLTRGSGVNGLAGIPPNIVINNVNILRPLLHAKKQDLQKYLQNKNIDWVEDPTNKTSKYTRNKLRHALEQITDKQLLDQRITNSINNIASAKSYINQQVNIAFDRLVKINEKAITFAKDEYLALHPELQTKILLKILQYFKSEAQARHEKLINLHEAIITNKKHQLLGINFISKDRQIIASE